MKTINPTGADQDLSYPTSSPGRKDGQTKLLLGKNTRRSHYLLHRHFQTPPPRVDRDWISSIRLSKIETSVGKGLQDPRVRGLHLDSHGMLSWLQCHPNDLTTVKRRLALRITQLRPEGHPLARWASGTRVDRVDNERYLSCVTACFEQHNDDCLRFLMDRLSGARRLTQSILNRQFSTHRVGDLAIAAGLASEAAGAPCGAIPTMQLWVALAGSLSNGGTAEATLGEDAFMRARVGLTMSLGTLGWLETAYAIGIYPKEAIGLHHQHVSMLRSSPEYRGFVAKSVLPFSPAIAQTVHS